MTLEEYKKALAAHDWFFCYADDGRAYEKGRKAEEWLMEVAREGGVEFKKAFNAAYKENTKSKTEIFDTEDPLHG